MRFLFHPGTNVEGLLLMSRVKRKEKRTRYNTHPPRRRYPIVIKKKCSRNRKSRHSTYSYVCVCYDTAGGCMYVYIYIYASEITINTESLGRKHLESNIRNVSPGENNNSLFIYFIILREEMEPDGRNESLNLFTFFIISVRKWNGELFYGQDVRGY